MGVGRVRFWELAVSFRHEPAFLRVTSQMALSLLHDSKVPRIGEGLGNPMMKEEKRTDLHNPADFHVRLFNGSQVLSSLGPLALHAPLFQSTPLLQWSAEQMGINVSSAMSAKKKKEDESPSSPAASPPQDKSNSREKLFVCRICNHSFGYKHVLQNHERTHTGEKPFECPQCHKRFTRDHHLKTHMRLHTGEKPYHCPHCERNFVQVANLRRHLRVHTGERPYACQDCSSKFSDSNQLKAHILIHRGEKPFECLQCRTKFRRRHHLYHHKCHNRLQEEEPAAKKRERKPKEVRRVLREPPIYVPLVLPEQTEPEDLSMSTGHKNNNNNINNNNNNNSSSTTGDSEDDLSDSWEEGYLPPMT